MPGFKVHITASSLAGIGYAAAAHSVYGLPGPSCLLAAGLCGVSGMLPDIDSDSGTPVRESLSFGAAVVATTLVEHFQRFGMPTESIILAAAGVYAVVRFGIGELLRHVTSHRGMFHSIPAALIFGELAFLLASGDVFHRCFLAAAVVIGYVSHLVLDEFWSIGLVRGQMAMKKSFGTALKLYSHNLLPTFGTYAALAVLSFMATQEPSWSESHALADHQRVSTSSVTGPSLSNSTPIRARNLPVETASPLPATSRTKTR